MVQNSHTLGIDFGTSNSAAGYFRDGKPQLITMDGGDTTLPTTFFFDFETRKTLIGEPANQALLSGAEGRFMRALKRVLGTSLMHEKRQLFNERISFVDIIGRFLAEIKSRAESESGLQFDKALSGRPVVFHGSDDPREDQAEADLRACYLAAGFEDVSFMAEPEAAAIASGALDQSGETGLIVDIGGGTSDFSVFRTCNGEVEILANHGIRIGGTDFDHDISFAQVMPLLGRGTLLRDVMGTGTKPAPNAIYNDLATWEKIPFLYTAQNRKMVADMVRQAEEMDKLNRLAEVLEDELGHEIAFGVEQGKISADKGLVDAAIPLNGIAPQLKAPLSGETLLELLTPYDTALRVAAQDTVKRAGLKYAQIDKVIYVGGSSLMSVVARAMNAQFPDATHSFSEVFTAVTDGLALAAGRA
ncbi:Hsp70 family protein [Neptunicoccus cionae]|uniref:Molecular chaperone DnaK n=1 Tax=Neptunicoccus cionae TaxID=2035344 RepID=A0A916VRM5_9RHOB|nr:Hsp70 family protein [Amylibacter cionae]GGA26695.1 molecular chaperone DnaK [Amylibacter cionae]